MYLHKSKLFYANEKVEYDEVKKSLNEIIKLKLFKWDQITNE